MEKINYNAHMILLGSTALDRPSKQKPDITWAATKMCTQMESKQKYIFEMDALQISSKKKNCI